MLEPVRLLVGDAKETLRELPEESVDSVITDPPYGLVTPPDPVKLLSSWLAGEDVTAKSGGFMGHAWDAFVPQPSVWRECFRVLKPGGYLLAFGGTRTYDRTASASPGL